MKSPTEWLISQNKYLHENKGAGTHRKTPVLSITGGKGGVGKTSICLKLAREMAEKGNKILVIDCDYNLSNTAVKLNLPLSDNFFSLITASKNFEDCLYQDKKFFLLSGCNGKSELFKDNYEVEKFIIDIINSHANQFDYVLLDSPAGLNQTSVTLNAYSDHRIVVVTPDRSSITDSYSLMKVLNLQYSTDSYHLLINKVSSLNQYKKVVKCLGETAEKFLNCRIFQLGRIEYLKGNIENFDRDFLSLENFSVHHNLLRFFNVQSQGDEKTSSEFPESFSRGNHLADKFRGQEVRSTLS